MQTFKKTISIFLLSFLFCVFSASGQTIYSAYSEKGIGLKRDMSVVASHSMGGLGISQGGRYYVNNINPAMLYSSPLTSFDAGFTGVVQNVSRDQELDQIRTGGIEYVTLSFPAMAGKWGINIGVHPYTSMNYSKTTRSEVNGTPTIQEKTGEGGLYQAYMGHGLKLTRGLSIGIKGAYLFGSLDETLTNGFDESSDLTGFFTSQQSQLTVSKLMVETGIRYQVKLPGENKVLNIGGIYQPPFIANATKETRNRISIPPSAPVYDSAIDEREGDITLPSRFGLGISYENELNFMVGADIIMQNWENYSNFEGDNENLQNSLEVKLGTEYIPDINSVESYFDRIMYRAGFHYKEHPMTINGDAVPEAGVSLGFGFPLKNSSLFNLSFEGGQRGFNQPGRLLERYFKIKIGVSYNDKWFIQQKYD